LAKQRLSSEELKQRESAMIAYLSEITPGKNAPILFVDKMMNELSALEHTLNKLKAFVNFLSKLNPLQYLEWMQNAYARYKASYNVQKPEEADVIAEPEMSPTPLQTGSLPLPGAKKGRKKKKATSLTPA
jgi:hypothetical protein